MIHEAYDLGVNFIDTATSYGTEGVVGALKSLPRDKVVIATRAETAPPRLDEPDDQIAIVSHA